MSKSFHLLLTVFSLFIGTGVLSGCLGDDSPTAAATDNCIVSAFRLNQLDRNVYTRTADGLRDSVISAKVQGKLYKFTIDQKQNLIYNIDSLPPATKIKEVSNITLTATGAVTYRLKGSSNETNWDSRQKMDLSQPVSITVYAPSGQGKRTYTLDVRVHQELGDSVTWTRPSMADWAAQQFIVPTAGIITAGKYRFKVSATGISRSQDGVTWLSDSVSSTDIAQLPTAELAAAVQPTRTNDSMAEVTLYGLQDRNARVWKLYIDATGRYHFPWICLPPVSNQQFHAPVLTNVRLLPYDDGLLLIGRDASGHPVLRYSADRGRTWTNHSSLTLPKKFPVQITSLEVGIDHINNLWILVDESQVWRARLHRLSWQQHPTVFTRSLQQ